MPKRAKRSERLEYAISSRFTAAEVDKLEEIAEANGLTVSSLVRMLCRHAMDRPTLNDILKQEEQSRQSHEEDDLGIERFFLETIEAAKRAAPHLF